MPLDQFGRAVDRLGTDEDFRLGDSGAEPLPVERANTRKGHDTLGVRIDQHAAAVGQAPKLALAPPHRPYRLLAPPVLPPAGPSCRPVATPWGARLGRAFLR